jgi:uncharacterized RDD family membrane protein YckC
MSFVDRGEGSGLNLPEGLVTGEAVVLELRPASFATRALALLLDLLVLGIVGLALGFGVAYLSADLDAAAQAALGLAVGVGVLVGIPVAVETLTRGRSLGKIAAGLRVVRDDGGPVRFRQAFVRALLAVVEIWLSSGSVALIASLASARGKRLGDVLAGTYVIRERSARPAPPVAMPPELAGWAQHADLGRIPDGLALSVRQFLGRAPGLHPASRGRLGAGLASEVSRHVAPPPPAPVDPERYLAAVLAERRRRDLDRLRREQQARAARAQRRAGTSVLAATSSRLVGEQQGPAVRT